MPSWTVPPSAAYAGDPVADGGAQVVGGAGPGEGSGASTSRARSTWSTSTRASPPVKGIRGLTWATTSPPRADHLLDGRREDVDLDPERDLAVPAASTCGGARRRGVGTSRRAGGPGRGAWAGTPAPGRRAPRGRRTGSRSRNPSRRGQASWMFSVKARTRGSVASRIRRSSKGAAKLPDTTTRGSGPDRSANRPATSASVARRTRQNLPCVCSRRT